MNDDVVKQLKKAMKEVRQQDWFNGEWQLQLTEPDDGGTHWAGIQPAKKGWFNEDGMGIHIETWVSEKELKSKQLPFQMHVLHQKTFPGTDRTARDFLVPWRELSEPADLISGWKGYKAGRIKPFTGKRRFNPDDIAPTIVEEFTRLHVLGVHVDRVLNRIR